MLLSLVFFLTSKCQTIRKIYRNSYYWWKKFLYFLKELLNFNEIYRKSVTYDNIKIHPESVLHALPREYYFRKTTGRGIFRVNKSVTDKDWFSLFCFAELFCRMQPLSVTFVVTKKLSLNMSFTKIFLIIIRKTDISQNTMTSNFIFLTFALKFWRPF